MSPAAQEAALGRPTPELVSSTLAPVTTDGKFLRAGSTRFLVKGVTYGTFAPDGAGAQFPARGRIAEDFALMRRYGINTVRVYTPPGLDLLDEAARHGLRVMVGLPWSQHVAFLDDRRLRRQIRREALTEIRKLAAHPAVLVIALGNEIPPGVVRWHGPLRVERFLRRLYTEAKAAAPDRLFTYVNFPPTEFLDLSFFDILAFNVYLHHEADLRAYFARLQNLAGHKPLLLAEAGADSIREGPTGQADITAMHLRAAFEEGAAGAVAFAWTDEWWRGGHSVDDWAFGLVDRDRRPKPAADAVRAVFEAAPFPPEVTRTWPMVSVVVCAYNASDTLEDCLISLERLSYPSYEIIVVNDGSRDRTSEIAHAHARARVIDVPNGGLSAARNIGLSHARGDIVAYTDADTRVDRDWLTFLVQPFLTSDVVGSGGPNVVPADDPAMAQCIARAPGGPTHVLLDDRIAEHVPGCNMAFRREALLSINGFNPIYLRAGDDVDVCWRLQARGGRIGFAASALVWHHHRASIKAYWRQQVGYGEGERWLMAHHPEKFLDGRMQWRGRIYSPLPFVRSLWGQRVNAGVWGTAAFPSVYRTDVHPFAFLPHSVNWQVMSIVIAVAGVVLAATGRVEWSALLIGVGLVGLAATLQKNIAYARRSDVSTLPGSKLWYRAVVAYLHFLQPFARVWGLVRGVLAPPEIALPAAEPRTSRGPRPRPGDAWRALLLGAGTVTEDRFWSETWTSASTVLNDLTTWLRDSHAVRRLEIDEGWSVDRDISILVGRWSWLDVRALVEEHERGRVLLRLSTHLRPTTFGVVGTSVLATCVVAAALAGVALRWPLVGAAAAAVAAIVVVFAAFRISQATALLRRAVAAVTTERGMTKMRSGPAHLPLLSPSLLRAYGLRTATVTAVALVAIWGSTLLIREAATAQIIGARKGYFGDNGPAIEAWLDTPGGIVVAATGEIFLADSNNHVVRRIDAGNKTITTVIGNNALGPGFSGDFGPATEAQLDTPEGVTIAPDGDLIVADSHNNRVRRIDRETREIATIAGSGEAGFDGDGEPAIRARLNRPSAVAATTNGDIYIADTLNYRVRMIDHATGNIHTIAGTGSPSDDENAVGDGGPATQAHLNMPSDLAIAPNGDLYIADMHHQRVRRIDAATRLISTVAGNGRWGHSGDGGPAVTAMLSGPAGLAVVPEPGGGVTLYIADYYNGHVRAVGPDGIIRDVSGGGRETFGAPTRVAFAPERGWLYVTDSSKDRLVVLTVRRVPERAPTLPEAPVPARPTARERTAAPAMTEIRQGAWP